MPEDELTEFEKKKLAELLPNVSAEVREGALLNTPKEMREEELIKVEEDQKETDDEIIKRKAELDAEEEWQRVVEERIESIGCLDLENRDEAKDYFLENFPEHKKFVECELWEYDVPDWFSTSNDELTDCDEVEKCVKERFEEYEEKIDDGLTSDWAGEYDGWEYYDFPTLDVAFEKRGDVPGLVWSADIFFVGNILSADEVELQFHVSMSVREQDEFFTPLNLLSGIYNGEVEPEGSEIVYEHSASYTTYKIKDYDENVDLRRSFIDFIRNLKSKNTNKTVFDRLHEIGVIDSSTLAIINNVLKRKEVKEKIPVTELLLGEKEKKELKKINQTIEKMKGKEMSYATFGKVLKKSRSGVFKSMKRMEAKKLIGIKKTKGGKKVFVSLTDLGRSLITKQ